MKYVADLHLHSKYSRAVSRDMVLPIMAEYAKKKGINILSTGDFTHPLWFREIQSQLEETKEGLFEIKDQRSKIKTTAQNAKLENKGPYFFLSVEISSIYSQGGKTRRIHNLIFSPSFETTEKISKELVKRGCNLMSDGRPIIGLSAKNLLELILTIDKRAVLIPAHCLKPESLLHTKEGMKKIKDIAVGDFVYTHNNRIRKVTEVFRRNYKGDLYSIHPWYFSSGLATTSEHPFLALRIQNCSTKGGRCLPSKAHKMICKKKIYESYKQEWIIADKLRVGDVLIFPRFESTTPLKTISLESTNYKKEKNIIYTGGTRGRVFPAEVDIGKEFCRLIGYYLAEGYNNGRDEIAFAFSKDELEYVEDVAVLMKSVFGINHSRVYRRKNSNGVEISFYSKLLVDFLKKHFYVCSPYSATTKTIPDWMLHLQKDFQAELLRGWWRGDGGYTSSPWLMNSMKVICLRLGIIPSIFKDSKENHLRRGNHKYKGRIINASRDSYVFSNLAFFGDPYFLKEDEAFRESIRKIERRHGWIDKDYIYLPIREIKKEQYEGEVFNIEVEEDNSYVAEFAVVHNCWTPWFSLFGSNSGFDSVEECFGEYSKYIFGIETGLSSDPLMNWQIKDLEKRTILSFSDSHSPAKMAREATVLELVEPTYKNIIRAMIHPSILLRTSPSVLASMKNGEKDSERLDNKIAYTIEFHPEEGKYHYNGHRNCKVVQSPQETREKGVICPVCKRPITVGVMQRVQALAHEFKMQPFDKAQGKNAKFKIDENGLKWFYDPTENHPPFVKLVPLLEIIAEALFSTTASGKVKDTLDTLCDTFGSEIKVLMEIPVDDVRKVAGDRVAEGVAKVRKSDMAVSPGFDGEYGKVKIWSAGKEETKNPEQSVISNKKSGEKQMGLF